MDEYMRVWRSFGDIFSVGGHGMLSGRYLGNMVLWQSTCIIYERGHINALGYYGEKA